LPQDVTLSRPNRTKFDSRRLSVCRLDDTIRTRVFRHCAGPVRLAGPTCYNRRAQPTSIQLANPHLTTVVHRTTLMLFGQSSVLVRGSPPEFHNDVSTNFFHLRSAGTVGKAVKNFTQRV